MTIAFVPCNVQSTITGSDQLKVSSLSAEVVEPSFAQQHETVSAVAAAKHAAQAVLQQLDRMGSAIALGEAGDLDGAHELRGQYAEV